MVNRHLPWSDPNSDPFSDLCEAYRRAFLSADTTFADGIGPTVPNRPTESVKVQDDSTSYNGRSTYDDYLDEYDFGPGGEGL